MDNAKLKEKWPQFKDALKDKWGGFTPADLVEIEGDYEKLVDKVQERYGERKHEVLLWVEEWHRIPLATKPAKRGKKEALVPRR